MHPQLYHSFIWVCFIVSPQAPVSGVTCQDLTLEPFSLLQKEIRVRTEPKAKSWQVTAATGVCAWSVVQRTGSRHHFPENRANPPMHTTPDILDRHFPCFTGSQSCTGLGRTKLVPEIQITTVSEPLSVWICFTIWAYHEVYETTTTNWFLCYFVGVGHYIIQVVGLWANPATVLCPRNVSNDLAVVDQGVVYVLPVWFFQARCQPVGSGHPHKPGLSKPVNISKSI